MGKFKGFKFAIGKAKPYLKETYGSDRSGISATFKTKKKSVSLHATVPSDAVQKGVKHLKKHKVKYTLGVSGVAGYAVSKLAQRKKKKEE